MNAIQYEKTLPAIFPGSTRIVQLAPLYENVRPKLYGDRPAGDSTTSVPLLNGQKTRGLVRSVCSANYRDSGQELDRQEPTLKNPENDSTEWIITPAELYGCLCHKPESLS